MKFIVEGEIRRKQRPRFVRQGNFVRTYTPQDTLSYEQWIKHCYLQSNSKMIIDKPISIDIICNFSVPKSFSNKKKEEALKGIRHPRNSKDVDNIAKVVLDALNKIAYEDDRYVVKLQIQKRYSEIEGLEITINTVEGKI